VTAINTAEQAAGILATQDLIDGIFTIRKAGDPDTAMAIGISQGILLGMYQPVAANVMLSAIRSVIGNPAAADSSGEDTARILAAIYENYLAAATAAVAEDPSLA